MSWSHAEGCRCCQSRQFFGGKRILLGITGGIAAVESVRLGRELRRHGAEIHVIMTKATTKVITPLAVSWATQSPVDVEWSGDMPQLDGFDAILVAPATRNTLSKHANGVMDSPLSMAIKRVQEIELLFW